MTTIACVLVVAASARAQILGGINTPAASGTVGQPFTISGWAVFAGDQPGTGIDAVTVYGCPILNCSTPTYWGAATIGLARPDVAAAYNNNNYLNSGYSMVMSGLTPNAQYYAKVRARRASTGVEYEFVVQFTATATPILAVGAPTQLQALTQPISFWGYAIDGAAPTGTGVTAVDVWSYPNPGSGTAPQYLGAATYGGDRPDVAAAYGARFQYSGYGLVKSGLTAGEHIFLTYAYSPTSGWFVQTTTNYVDIPTVSLTIDRQGTGTGAITASGLTCAGGSNTQAVPCGASYAQGTVVTLTPEPDSGSGFSGWFGGGCSGTGTCQVTMNNAKFVMAMFSKAATGFTVHYYHVDRIGSVRAMTDAAGDLVGPRHDYAPFGEDTQALTGNPIRFGGKELDEETAFHYFDARYYRQTWGRFTQVDPLHVGAAMVDPQQWNRYAYARNNPLKFGDPTGLSLSCLSGPITAACSETVIVTPGPDPTVPTNPLIGNGIGNRPGNNAGASTIIVINGLCYDAHSDDPTEAYFGGFACPEPAPPSMAPVIWAEQGSGGGPGPNTGVQPNVPVPTATPPPTLPIAGAAGSDPVNSAVQVLILATAWMTNPILGFGMTAFSVGYSLPDWGSDDSIDTAMAILPFGSLPRWVRNGGTLVNHALNLQKAGGPVTKEVADDIVNAARQFGVNVRLDPPHPGTPWNVPHLNVGRNGQAHVAVPAGYRLPD